MENLTFEQKLMIVQAKKLEIGLYIKYAHDKYEENIDYLRTANEYYNDFLTFIDMIKICETYKWEELKFRYTFLKKKITFEKKLKKNAIKEYSNIINYYTQKEVAYFNGLIAETEEYYNKMLLDFETMKKNHKEMFNKIRNALKSKTIIKIYELRDEYKELLMKLYDNFTEQRLLNKQYYKLKKKKAELLSELNPNNDIIV